MMRRARARRERGAALIIVLWMLLLLSLLAAAFISTSRSDLAIARNDVEAARARALADAGITRAVLAITEPDPAKRWRSDGTAYEWPFGGGVVTVEIVGESGKIDLNAAPEAVLQSLFRRAGADAAESARLAAAVLARRAARAAAALPAGGPPPPIDPGEPAFAEIEDLGTLPGIAAPVLHAALPLVTVYSRLPTVDPTTAPRDVLLALPGADPAEIDPFIAARRAQAEGSGIALAPPPSLAPYLVPAAAPAVTITADATTDTGARFERAALVLLRDAQGQPFVVKRWSQSMSNKS